MVLGSRGVVRCRMGWLGKTGKRSKRKKREEGKESSRRRKGEGGVREEYSEEET